MPDDRPKGPEMSGNSQNLRAVQWLPDQSLAHLPLWFTTRGVWETFRDTWTIASLDWTITFRAGDWIILGENGIPYVKERTDA